MVKELDLDKDSQKLSPVWELNLITFRTDHSCPEILRYRASQEQGVGVEDLNYVLANDHQMMKGYKVGRVAMEIDRIVH